MTDQARLDQLTVNTIRTLSMDAVQAANSGHRHPHGAGAVAYCLWQRFLRFDPDDRSGPTATGSCCRAATLMLLYSLLHWPA